jgi:hypothetical protein
MRVGPLFCRALGVVADSFSLLLVNVTARNHLATANSIKRFIRIPINDSYCAIDAANRFIANFDALSIRQTTPQTLVATMGWQPLLVLPTPPNRHARWLPF